MKNGDVRMAKCFSKNYWNKGWAFNYLQSDVKMPVSAWFYIPTSLPQEQAAKTNMVLVKGSKYLVLCTVEEGVANTCIWLTIPMKLEKQLYLLDRREMAAAIYLRIPLSRGWLQAS